MKVFIVNNYKRIIVMSLLAIVIALIPLCVSADIIATGGFVSEKLLGGSGDLLIGFNTQSLLVYGKSPIIITQAPTNIHLDSVTHATLNGNIINMGDVTNLSYYFEWGYDTSYGNTTPLLNATSIGTVSSTISNYKANELVYYRLVVKSGTVYVYGSSSTVSLTSGGIAYRLLTIIFPITLAAIAVFLVLAVKIDDSYDVSIVQRLITATFVGCLVYMLGNLLLNSFW